MAFGTVAVLGLTAAAAFAALAFGKKDDEGASKEPGRKSSGEDAVSGVKLDAGMPEYWESLAIAHLSRGTNPIALEALSAIYQGKGWPKTAALLAKKATMVREAWAKHEPVPGWTYDAGGNPVPDPTYGQPGLPDPNVPRPGKEGETTPPQIQPTQPAGPVDPSSIGLPPGGWIDAQRTVHYALQPGDWGSSQIAANWGQPNGGPALQAHPANAGFPWGSAPVGADLVIPAGWWKGPLVPTTQPAGGAVHVSGGGGQASGGGGGGKGGKKPGVAGQYSNPPDKPPTGQVGGTPPGWKDPMAPPEGWKPPPGMPPAEPPGGPPFTPQTPPLTVDIPGIGEVEIPGVASFGFGGGGQEPLQRGIGGTPTLPPEDVGREQTPWTPW